MRYTSDFYDHQLSARERMGNKLVFTYDYSKQCIKLFLDIAHGIDVEPVGLVIILELIKFLKFENKG